MPGGWAAVEEAAVLSFASVTTQSSISEPVEPAGGHWRQYLAFEFCTSSILTSALYEYDTCAMWSININC